MWDDKIGVEIETEIVGSVTTDEGVDVESGGRVCSTNPKDVEDSV